MTFSCFRSKLFLTQIQQAASPACTELETIVLDWLGKAIGLPDDFLAFKGKGGGVIQVTQHIPL